MIWNYLTIAYRNLVKKKIYTFINIAGLSTGAAVALIIFLYVQHELSYDTFTGHQDVYRMVEDRIYPDRVAYFTLMPGGFAQVLPDEIPEVETTTRVVGFPNFSTIVRQGDNVFTEHYFFSADSNFFDVFPYKLLKGNPDKVLRDVNTVVMTESTAKRYFGEQEAIGKFIKAFDQDIEVVGVMEDVPENSHMKFDMLGPTAGIDFLEDPNFYIAGTYTYVKLRPGASPEAVDSKMPALVEKYAASQIERDLGVSYQKYVADGNGYKYFLQPIADIHLHSHRINEIKPNGSITTVNSLIAIGVLIIIIAAINFVNLATARSVERAKEVGVRKVLGSRRAQLIGQFLSESMLITLISLAIAIGIAQLSLGFFNNLTQQQLEIDPVGNPLMGMAVLAVALTLGLLGGLYPAFFISALKPAEVLKGKFKSSTRGGLLRNGLVIFQFTIAVMLISSTLVVYQQLRFVSNKDLGFQKENLVVINHTSNGNESEGLQTELRKLAGVKNIGSGNTVPGGYFFGLQFRTPGASEIFTPKGYAADDHFNEVLGLKLVEGRLFGPGFNDSLAVVVNEAAVKAMDLENPIGTTLLNAVDNGDGRVEIPYTIVGVVEDFNYESLHTPIAPIVIMSTEGQINFQNVMVARIASEDLPATISQLESVYKRLVPGSPFVYNFMDARLDELYKEEKSSGKLLTVLSSLAILIACVGLFGLTAYTVNQKTKEIGVRKVMGATVAGIVTLLSASFAKLVMISLVLGIPVAWFLLSEWLQTFAYRISLTAATFVLAGILVMLFTLLTISYQAIGAARVNPVDSLKEE